MRLRGWKSSRFGKGYNIMTLSHAFNCAVQTMARTYCPNGWDVSPDLDVGSLEALQKAVAYNGRMIVWGGASDKTIYGDTETNYAYRAWHDACHLMGGFPFTLDGEQAATRLQIRQLISAYGRTNALTWGLLLHCEAVEQTVHFLNYEDFVDDQLRFTQDFLLAVRSHPSLSIRDVELACAGEGSWAGLRFTIGTLTVTPPPLEAWEIPQVSIPLRRPYKWTQFRGRNVKPAVVTREREWTC